MTSRWDSSSGLSLVEVMVATLLMLTLTATMLGSFRYHLFALKRQEAQLDVQESARSLVDLVVREIRHAGYDPTCVKTFEGIANGRAALLQIQSDRNGNGVIGADESVTYSYDASSHEIHRATAGVAIPLISGSAGNTLAFTYYDGGGTVLTPSGTPPELSTAQRTAIRQVKIAVHLERSSPDPLSHTPLVADLVTNVDLRNRFLNSGAGCL